MARPISSISVSRDRTFDPNRHQGFVREWLVGYRTQLPGSVVVDASYIHREYRDRPALVDNNQIYTSSPTGVFWSGLNNPAFNNFYLVTNNRWNWFVYQGYELTVTKQTPRIQLFSTYSYSPDHLAGSFQPNDPVSILEPTKFANNAGLGSVRGNTTNDYTGDTRNRMWHPPEYRAGSRLSKHEGESSLVLCDRLDRTRANSQRQLPTDYDYAVPTREYQTDQSSLNTAQAAAGSALGRQRQDNPGLAG